MRGRNKELEINQTMTSIVVFMEAYNKNIPASFPKVSVKTLKKFQVLHPVLFKNGDEWSIYKHRKKLMDWLPSYCDVS